MPLSKRFHQICCSISQIRVLLKRRKEEGLEAKEKRAVDRKSNVGAHILEEIKKNVSFICNYSVGQCPCPIWKSPRVQAGRCEDVAIVRNEAIYA